MRVFISWRRRQKEDGPPGSEERGVGKQEAERWSGVVGGRVQVGGGGATFIYVEKAHG